MKDYIYSDQLALFGKQDVIGFGSLSLLMTMKKHFMSKKLIGTWRIKPLSKTTTRTRFTRQLISI